MGEPLERFQVGALVQHPIVNPLISQHSLRCMVTCAHWCAKIIPVCSSSPLDQRNRKSSPRGGMVDTSSILREGYTEMQSCIWAAFSLFPAQKLGIFFLLFYSLLVFFPCFILLFFPAAILQCRMCLVPACEQLLWHWESQGTRREVWKMGCLKP